MFSKLLVFTGLILGITKASISCTDYMVLVQDGAPPLPLAEDSCSAYEALGGLSSISHQSSCVGGTTPSLDIAFDGTCTALFGFPSEVPGVCSSDLTQCDGYEVIIDTYLDTACSGSPLASLSALVNVNAAGSCIMVNATSSVMFGWNSNTMTLTTDTYATADCTGGSISAYSIANQQCTSPDGVSGIKTRIFLEGTGTTAASSTSAPGPSGDTGVSCNDWVLLVSDGIPAVQISPSSCASYGVGGITSIGVLGACDGTTPTIDVALDTACVSALGFPSQVPGSCTNDITICDGYDIVFQVYSLDPTCSGTSLITGAATVNPLLAGSCVQVNATTSVMNTWNANTMTYTSNAYLTGDCSGNAYSTYILTDGACTNNGGDGYMTTFSLNSLSNAVTTTAAPGPTPTANALKLKTIFFFFIIVISFIIM